MTASTNAITTREATRATRIWRCPAPAEVSTSSTSRIRSPHTPSSPRFGNRASIRPYSSSTVSRTAGASSGSCRSASRPAA